MIAMQQKCLKENNEQYTTAITALLLTFLFQRQHLLNLVYVIMVLHHHYTRFCVVGSDWLVMPMKNIQLNNGC